MAPGIRGNAMVQPLQINLGTLMIAIAAVAVVLASTHVFGPLLAVFAIPPAVRVAAYSDLRSRCRIAGREPDETDRRETDDLVLRVGLPIFVLSWIGAIIWTLNSR
jgi:hypothetical protein